MQQSNQQPAVVLIIPNTRWHGRRPWMMVPHAPLILTALLKEHFAFSILDANVADLSEAACEARLRELQPAAVLVSGFGTEYHRQYHACLAMAKRVNPAIVTVLGGVYPTTLSEEAIKDPHIDYLFLGHAEERVVEFLHLALARDTERLATFPGIHFRAAAGEIVANPVAGYIGDVQRLSKPDYSLMDLDGYLRHTGKEYQINSSVVSAPIISSYGCPYRCNFCASHTISGQGVVYRPVEDVLEEMDFLRTAHDVRHFIFLDDCLLASRPRIETLLRAFIARDGAFTWKAVSVSAWHLDDALLELMKASGCTQITVSVESGSRRVLREIMHKPLKLEQIPPIVAKCKELGIDIGANFVIGNPGETWDEIRQSFTFAEACDFDLAHFHLATPLPQTELYEVARRQGLLPADFSFLDPTFFGFARGYITTDEFTPSELMALRAYEWDRINFNRPEKIEKIARMMCLTLDELQEHRRQTRRKCGIHY
ncbi:MAG: B12-binding domain-containing radical SAM protein [Armatimonadota bacterium]